VKLSIPAGTTSKRIGIFIQDSSSTTGAGLSGLVFNTSGLKCYSWIDTDGNAAGTAQTLATATLGTWTTIGFVEKDATNMKGMYEFGIPNALIAAGVKWAILYFYGATNMAPLVLEIEVTAVSNQDAVRGGMTALPNFNANAAGGLPVSIAGGLDLDEMNVDIEAIQTSTAGLTFTGAGKVDASVRDWVGDTIPARNVTGVPIIDAKYLLGTIFATPATAGIPDVNTKNINNISAAAVTTIRAFIGSTQDLIFNANNFLKVSLNDILATTLTETAGQLAAGFKKWFNVASPTSTMNEVTLVDTVTTYTGNTPQTGDVFAQLPTNFHALSISVAGKINEVVLTDTLTTYTGNTPQTGDSFALIGATGSGLTSLAPAATALSTAQWTNARALLLDNLGVLKIKKNSALAAFPFLMVLSADHVTPATGLTVVVQRSINGGAFANSTNTPATEVANGVYVISLSAADLNGDTIVLKMTSATADQRTVIIATEP